MSFFVRTTTTKANVPSLNLLRSFSTTPLCHKKQQDFKPVPKGTTIPDYPYGESRWYKQSNLGLYGLQKIRYGNIVSEKNEIKTRRHWRPNVQHKHLWSAFLGRAIRLRVTTRVMRTIDKSGGLDAYLLGEKVGRIKELGVMGWAMRWRVMQTKGAQEMYDAQRVALGLAPLKKKLVGVDGSAVSTQQHKEAVRAFDEGLARDDAVLALEDGLVGDVEVVDEIIEDESQTEETRRDRFMEEEPPRAQDAVKQTL